MGRTALCRGHRGAPAERGDAVSGAGGLVDGRPGAQVVPWLRTPFRHFATRRVGLALANRILVFIF